MTDVERAGASVPTDATPLDIPPKDAKLTHYLFRYPAKFHPPVVRVLLERYSEPGAVVLDPFCGSGTLLVEAAAMGRNSIGLDVDPLAVAVSNAKVHRHDIGKLRASAKVVSDALEPHRRTPEEYRQRQFEDLDDGAFRRELALVADAVPAIPNLNHWFRRYVVDLARIRIAIAGAAIPRTHRSFLSVVFASVIRNASNADPVPVSGLEVTRWMREREAAGRTIDPFALFDRALSRGLDAAMAFAAAAEGEPHMLRVCVPGI